MFTRISKTTLLISTLFIAPAFALVDYTEEEYRPASVKKAAAPRVTRAQNTTTRKAPGKKSNFSLGNFYLSYDYNQTALEQDGSDLMSMKLAGHFQTNYNIFVQVSHDMYQSSSETLTEDSSWQNGNTQIGLGFNWLRFGKPVEMATLDLIAGLRLGSKDEIASERMDKFAAVETSKRFHDFAIALGYEYHLTEEIDSPNEMSVGNIGILKASLGWVVSHDIRFSMEGATVFIDKASEGSSSNRLSEDVKYSYVSPKLTLGLGRSISLNMGATFRTNRAKSEQNLEEAKLWHLPGLYGNSLFAGLEYSI